ncbi:copper amine oxidase N-terminal domain-containing protein [Paenibacillus sp. GCM10023248]|uniref:copper amine oxidase N-terminal domain-containing protein n=1 Tax=unclassified Paenibacillus TaxID=185978 RepID=UPI0023798067|nr:copper amine oxidase N-terminal domain-containing protein [Paenibacillus sp. MAHUQ-63]MDD9269441.1 copper amine oxidase N-terminal domain-containing protein [Paenibacillus sp. MAHUQ-63]
MSRRSRLRRSILFLFTALCLSAPRVYAESDVRIISVYLGDERLTFEQEPVLEEGVTLVPFRTIFEKLGYTVNWNAATQTISAERGGSQISLVIGSSLAAANHMAFYLEQAPMIVNGNSLVPLRFVAEASGAAVTWDQATYQVKLFIDQTETAELKIKRAVESYAYSKSAHDFIEAITRSDGTKNNGYQVDTMTWDEKRKEAVVQYTLDFWISHPKLLNDKDVNSESMDIIVKIKQKLISDEYGHWYLSPNLRDREYLVIPK